MDIVKTEPCFFVTKDRLKLSMVAEMMDEYTRAENYAYHKVLAQKSEEVDTLKKLALHTEAMQSRMARRVEYLIEIID